MSFASHGWLYEPNRAAEHFWTISSSPHDKREDTTVKNQLKFDERLLPDSSRLILNLKSLMNQHVSHLTKLPIIDEDFKL